MVLKVKCTLCPKIDFPIFEEKIMSGSENDWKKRLGTVYSTNPDFNYDYNENQEDETLPPEKQKLRISLDRKQRKGKTVSLITGFIGREDDLKELAASLKKRCGTGGSSGNGEMLIQGDFRQRLKEMLEKDGYNVKLI